MPTLVQAMEIALPALAHALLLTIAPYEALRMRLNAILVPNDMSPAEALSVMWYTSAPSPIADNVLSPRLLMGFVALEFTLLASGTKTVSMSPEIAATWGNSKLVFDGTAPGDAAQLERNGSMHCTMFIETSRSNGEPLYTTQVPGALIACAATRDLVLLRDSMPDDETTFSGRLLARYSLNDGTMNELMSCCRS